MAVPPVVRQTAPWPKRSEAPANFSAMADAVGATMPNTVDDINASITWMAASVAATLDYKTSAATSATAATNAAGSAAASAASALQAKTAAEAAAIAAGSAAGLPAQRVPNTALRINAARQVEWGYGVPDTGASSQGRALTIGANGAPTWNWGIPLVAGAKVGQAVIYDPTKGGVVWGDSGGALGDVLYTSRNPGAGYLPANGGIYLQSAYPALFALVGLIGGSRGLVFANGANMPSASGFLDIRPGENDLVLALCFDNRIYRSTNRGTTFPTSVALPSPAVNGYQLYYMGNKVWLIIGVGTAYMRSIDDGVTWSALSTPAVYPIGGIRGDTDGNGVILLRNNDGTATIKSTNYGVTWTSQAIANIDMFRSLGGGKWVARNTIASGQVRLSLDEGVTWTAANTGLAGILACLEVDRERNTIMGSSSVTGTNAANAAVSKDGGATWVVVVPGGTNAPKALIPAGNNTWVVVTGDSVTNGARRSADGGTTFGPVSGTFPVNLTNGYADSKGRVVLHTLNANAQITISDPVLGYDPATQFKVPTLTAAEGLSSYIKAVA